VRSVLGPEEPGASLLKLSIAAKLYAIFASMATVTVILAVFAAMGARHHAVLTQEFEIINAGSASVERVRALIYAIEAHTRAIYLTDNSALAREHAAALEKAADDIGAVVSGWQGTVGEADAATFSDFAVRLYDFKRFPGEVARIAVEQGPGAARGYARGNERTEVRQSLTNDLTKIASLYARRATRIYTQLQDGIDKTAMVTSLFAGLAMLLGLAGVAILGRSITRPLNEVTRITEVVAEGNVDVTVPFAERHDEVGALARAIAVFQGAMRRNTDLKQIVQSDAESRKERQEQVAAEIARFSAEVEATLAQLGRISDEMLGASRQLSSVAGDAAQQTARATECSREASANVRDIASAAFES
jgi:methyl-accepting chemotaxis protein